MLILVTLAALLLATLGLCAVRTAPVVARWLALLAAVAFAVVGSLADRTEGREVAPRLGSAKLGGTSAAERTRMLAAAARSGPRADELTLVWEPSERQVPDVVLLADQPRSAVTPSLGARAVAPAGLPFAPGDVRIRAATRLLVGRPAMFEVEVVGLTGTLAAEVLVTDGVDAGYRDSIQVSAQATAVAFTPARAGSWTVSLQIICGEHRVNASGAFVVEEPSEVLVVDSGGVVAAALRAQGERVRESAGWPMDWREHDRIVLGRVLPRDQQAALARAVDDGTGLFVLAAAFGDDGSPLREILPVQPLPKQPRSGDGEGAGAGASSEAGQESDGAPPQPDAAKPPAEQVQEDPPEAPPPTKEPTPPRQPEAVGDTQGAKPVSKDPIEVDRHSVAMVLIVDRSGSMGDTLNNGLTKMSYAKTSALRTALALDVGDRVGVVSFGNRKEARVELPMTDALDDATIQDHIEKLTFHNEYTFLLSAVQRAHEMLRAERMAVKHVVVITDGEFRDQSQALRREAFLMRSKGKITLSIISMIDSLTQPGFKVRAQQLADEGRGLFLTTSNPSKVPVIVSSEVSRALSRVGRKPRGPGDRGDGPGQDQPTDPPEEPKPDKPDPDPVEDPPKPDEPEDDPEDDPEPAAAPEDAPSLTVRAVTDSPLLVPEPDEWPSLGSAVRSVAPLEARVLLVAGDEGWPLLAFANRGLGRVGAFAAELGGEDGREFRSAQAFPAWIAQWLAATTAADEAGEARDVHEVGEVLPPTTVPADIRWLTAVSGQPVVQISPEDVASPAGKRVVEQVAEWAPWLVVALLMLAIGERVASSFALRRGRS